MERWNEHFKSVFNRPEPDHPVTLEQGPDLNIKVVNIKKPEIKKALKWLKNDKAAEIDEALKHGGEEICEFLFKLLNKIWDDETIPTKWNKAALKTGEV